MNKAEAIAKLVERMGPCGWNDIDAEAGWSQAVLDLQRANLEFLEYIASHVPAARRTEGTPVREILSELPAGTWLVARFDHCTRLADVLQSVMAEPVGMLGSAEAL